MLNYSRQTRLQLAGAIFCAVVAGYLDGYGFLILKTYVGFMSGNTTSSGVMIGSGHFCAASNAALAIICFVAGSFVGALLAQSKGRHFHRVSFAIIAMLLATVAGLEWYGPGNKAFEIALLCLAMGVMNPALSKIGVEPVSLTFMTGTLNRIGGHLASAVGRKPLKDSNAEGDSHLRRAGLDTSVWSGFLVGAVLAGMLLPSLRALALLPPCAVMVLLGVFSDRTPETPVATHGHDGSVGIVPQESRRAS
jgi:uncharacterized membrane protein YoaK (UPF0700 family)